MKHITSAVVLFFILLLAYTKFAGPLPLSVTSITTTKNDTFTVSGQGKVQVTPDIARVSVGVVSQGPSVKVVQSDLNRKANAIADAVKKLGIDGSDIQTSNYSIYPNYDYREGGNQHITGYQASSTLTVKVRDIDRTNDVVDTATAEGANTIGGIQFDVENRDHVENEARKQAVSDAKKKAQVAADAAGFSLGRIINYSESPGPEPMLPFSTDMRLEKANTNIEPGSNEILIRVSLSYEIH